MKKRFLRQAGHVVFGRLIKKDVQNIDGIRKEGKYIIVGGYITQLMLEELRGGRQVIRFTI